MTLSELIAAVGDDHVEFQNLMQGDLDLSLGKRDGRIAFHTARDKVQDLMHGGRRYLGLVVWLPKNRIPDIDIPPDANEETQPEISSQPVPASSAEVAKDD